MLQRPLAALLGKVLRAAPSAVMLNCSMAEP